MAATTITPPPVSPPAAGSSPPLPAPRRGLHRWLKRLLPLILVLALSVWFAPTIIAKTPLRNYFARKALAELHGSVQIGSASLGWFSPLTLREITLTDEAGQTIATIGEITSTKTLVALLGNSSDLGRFTVNRPAITVICRNGSTNIEQALAHYLVEDPSPQPAPRSALSIHFSDGQLTLTEASDGRSQQIASLKGELTIPASRAEPTTLHLQAATGQLDAKAVIGDSHTLHLQTHDFPLAIAVPVLTRFGAQVSLDGWFTCDLKFQHTHEHFAVAGHCAIRQLAYSGPELLGDTLRLESAQLPLNVEVTNRSLRVRQFDLTCDVGTLSASGHLDYDEVLTNVFSQPGIAVRAKVELAALAAQLPRLLHIKDGVELRGGQLDVKLTSHADTDGVIWDGILHTSALEAVRAGQTFRWDDPLHLEFTSRYTPGQLPQFDKLICTADFIALNARTTPETIQAAVHVYLHRLAHRLGQFVDWGDLHWDGEALAELTARRTHDERFTASGRVQLKNLVLTWAENQGLKEPALDLQWSAQGRWDHNGLMPLDEGSLTLRADTDELRVTLLEPVDDLRRLTRGTVALDLKGDIARWKSRIAAFVTVPSYAMSGSMAARGQAQWTEDRVNIDRLNLELRKFHFRGAGLTIDEPSLDATANMTLTTLYDTDNTATFRQLELKSTALTVEDGTLQFNLHRQGAMTISGSGRCVAELQRVGRIVGLSTDPHGRDAFHGRAGGPISFHSAGDVTSFRGTLEVTNFAYGLEDAPLWSESQFTLEVDGRYTDSNDSLTFALAHMNRPGLSVNAKGTVSQVTTSQELSFSGTLRYDWSQLSPAIRDWLGGQFTATGTGTRAFRVNGPVGSSTAVAMAPTPQPGRPIVLKAPGAAPSPPPPSLWANLSGEAAIGWNRLSVYGFDVGSADLEAKMTRGVVTITPLRASFGGGSVTLSPTLKLDTTPGELRFAKGRIVERAKLTPQVTAGALGYALPAIANATQAEGEISATLGDNRIPLDDFTQTNLQGTLVIHRAVVGTGPVVSAIAQLLGANTTSMTLASETTVPVQIANGRIHHQNFTFRIGGTTLRTSGSVGFDNTLDLIVDVPLPKDWPALRNNPVLQNAISGKVVPVPVGGTLAQPQIDRRAFEQAVMNLARESVKGAGRELLERELNKLFPGLPARPNPATPTPPGSPRPLPFPLPFGKKP